MNNVKTFVLMAGLLGLLLLGALTVAMFLSGVGVP